MRTIQTRGTVSSDRKLIIDVPSDIAPGEHQVVVIIADLPSQDLPTVVRHGGASDWLEDEPDLYIDRDGEPVDDSSLTARRRILDDLGLVALPWRSWPENATFRRGEIYGNDGR